MIPVELTEHFHHSLVRKNPSGQDYVAIDGYINRLNSVLGASWSWDIVDSQFYPDAAPQTKNGKNQYLAIVQGSLSIDFDGVVTKRAGIGSNINFDPDTAVKSAQAEALKKACHQFGIALYLWQEAERNFIALQKAAATNDVALKSLAVGYTQRIHELDPATMPDTDLILETLGSSDLSVDNIRARFNELGVL